MALPIPTCPVVIPSFSTVIGDVQKDPITKSTQTLPVVYDVENVCDTVTGKKFRISMNINENIDCTPVANSQLSISGQVPPCAKQADLDTLIDYLKNVLKTQFPAA